MSGQARGLISSFVSIATGGGPASVELLTCVSVDRFSVIFCGWVPDRSDIAVCLPPGESDSTFTVRAKRASF